MTDKRAQLDALYAELPTIECQRKCALACGPIDMSNTERERIAELGVTIPVFTGAAAQRWADNEKIDTCRALKPHPLMKNQGICGVYEVRPMICRLWGLTESMPCEWGCKPSRVMSDAEGFEYLSRSLAISGDIRDRERQKGQDNVVAAMAHPVIGPLLKRFLAGDRSVRVKLEKLMTEAGFTTI